MLIRLLAAAGLVAAGVALAACQTTPAYSNEADRACQDYGLSPGTESYDDCITFVRQSLLDAEHDFEDEYGPINPRFRCVITEITEDTVFGECELIDYDI